MGPCCFCHKMIYLDWIAERGFHRECNEKYVEWRKQQCQSSERAVREQEKRRLRRAKIRQDGKLTLRRDL